MYFWNKKSRNLLNHVLTWACFYLFLIIKNVSSSTSHKKTPSFRLYVFTSLRLYVFTSLHLYIFRSLRLYVFTRIYENNSGHILHQHSWVVQPSMQLWITRSGTLNAFPKLCERFSALFPLKGSRMVPSFALWRDANFS